MPHRQALVRPGSLDAIISLMFHSSSHRQHKLRWVGGAAFAVTALAALGYWFVNVSREQSWAPIQAAVDSQRWVEAETGLRRWLGQKPGDGNAWMMLGDLLFDQGRWDEALSALLRVRAVDKDWPHAQTLIGEIWIKRRNLS
jgi:cytochrome c-type biogenesis protein CcmH/NrfG